MAAFTDIPVVDLGGWRGDEAERAAFAERVRGICHEVGFFLLVNHGVEDELVDSLFSMMERLFALSDEEKALIDKRRSPHFRGWEAVGTEFTNNQPDIREQVDLWSEHPARDADVDPAYLHLLGPNQWFPEQVLPGYRQLMSAWTSRMGDLADELLAALSVGLGMDTDGIGGRFGSEPMSLIKLISYPETPTGAMGVNPHHDAGFVTILSPGSTPGLEVQNPDGAWIPVPLQPGAFVVNLGEMLQGISGNYFVATPHRVITAEPRLSTAYFHGPSLDTSLEPLDLDPRFAAAVDASPHHSSAGFMTQADETDSGVPAMASPHRPDLYGEQLWNYFSRSYPEMVAEHYG